MAAAVGVGVLVDVTLKVGGVVPVGIAVGTGDRVGDGEAATVAVGVLPTTKVEVGVADSLVAVGSRAAGT